MKIAILLFCLFLPFVAIASDDYDNGYCKDPVELQKWADMLEKNPDDDVVAALHALWIGLCVKVEAHTLTTERANMIFEDFRWGIIIESIEAEEDENQKKDAT
jgi:hypothetical protein